MSEEDLELLITLDDPEDAQEEDIFNHLHQRAEAVGNNDSYKVAFGQGDWTCILSRLISTTNDSMKGLDGNIIQSPNKKFEIEVCTVTCSKNGEIVEQKVFYNLVGTPKQIGLM
ncbi:MAG TPA: hypothetical protein VK208_10535 [Pyrinomonadaceae bacterium]|nr:hypothetical protein [Pyrinomonadaceae bacterium]